MNYLTTSWEFFKRHKGKLATGVTVVGAVVVAKKILDSEVVYEIVHKVNDIRSTDNYLHQPKAVEEARANFIFDTHQQSCNKALQYVIVELRTTISGRFNTDELISYLHSENITGAEKIRVWEKLKVKAVAKVVALIYSYPLVTIALKVHRSILSHELCKTSKYAEQNKLEGGEIINYLSSFIWASPTEKSPMISNSKIQQLFSHCIKYLTTDGIECLLSLIKQLTNEFIGAVKLTDELSCSDLKDLLQKIGSKLDLLTGNKNFTDFIVPLAGQVTIENSLKNQPLLKNLLDQYATAMNTRRCRDLMLAFQKLYLSAVMEFLNENVETDKKIPLAKMIPILTKAFLKVSTNRYDSVLYHMLNDSSLYQFTSEVFSYASDLTLPALT